MSKKPETFTINMQRLEIQWLHRHLTSAMQQALAQLESLKGPQAVPNEVASVEEYYLEIQRLTGALHDRLVTGNKERLDIVQLKDELEDAYSLVGDNPDAKAEIDKRLADLPKEETYRITFDKETAKLTLKMLEKDLTHFRQHVIPGYEKKDSTEFKDVIQTKLFWINKAIRAKDILDGLKSKIEREL